MNLRQAAQQALEALEYYEHRGIDWCYADKEAITALRTALAEPEQEPVAVVSSVVEPGQRGVRVKWLGGFPQIGDCLYTHPPQRTEPEQEPVAWRDPRIKSPGQGCTYDKAKHDIWPHLYPEPLYTHPPQRKPLTDEEICHVVRYEAVGTSNLDIARAIERAHGIGGEA